MIHKYLPIITTGINGTTIRHSSTEENPISILGKIDGYTYISTQTDLVSQNEELEFIEVVLNDDELNNLKSQRHLKLLDKNTQRKMDDLVKDYPKFEVETFWIQEAEAKAYIDDNDATTPFLDDLAEQYAISKDDLATKIITNSQELKKTSAMILGEYKRVLS